MSRVLAASCASLLLVVFLHGGLPPAESREKASDTHPMRGRVVKPDGVGVEGVQVDLIDAIEWELGPADPCSEHTLLVDPEPRRARVLQSVTTSEDGRYAFGAVDPWGDVRIRIRPPAPWTKRDLRSRQRRKLADREFVVTKGAVLRGHIVDSHGRPVRGLVSLRALPSAYARHSDAWVGTDERPTDAGGAFHFEAVPQACIELRIRLPKRGLAVRQHFVWLPRTEPLVLAAEAPSPAVVEGRVLDATGAPVPLARVVVTATNASPRRAPIYSAATETDANGSYRVTGVSRGRLVGVEVFARGFVPSGPWYARQSLGESPFRADVVVGRGMNVEGRVLTRNGQPVPRAFVRTSGGRWTWSDAEGRYRLVDLPVRQTMLLAHGRDHVPMQGRNRDVVNGQVGATVKHDIEMASRVGIAGVVVAPDGRRVADARVTAAGVYRYSDSAPSRRLETRSDEQGRFTLRGLWPDDNWIVDARKGDLISEPPSKLRIQAGNPVHDLRLVLRPGGSMAGRVVDEKGAPVAGAVVRRGRGRGGGWWEECVTDASGAFAFHGLRPGKYTALTGGGMKTSEVADSASTTVDWGADVTGLRIVSKPLGGIVGRVLRPEGKPVSGVEISIQSTVPTTFSDRWHFRSGGDFWRTVARTDDTGHFRCDHLLDGAWWIRPARRGRETSQAKVGEHDVVLDYFEPAAQSYLTVRIKGPDDEPVGTAEVMIWGKSSAGWVMPVSIGRGGTAAGPLYSQLTHGETEFFDVVVERAWDVHGRQLDVLPTRLEGLRARSGETVVRLPAAATISGRVNDVDGKPVAGVRVHAGKFPTSREHSWTRDTGKATWTDHGGRFEFKGVEPEAKLEVWAEATPPWLASAPIPAAAGDADLTLELRSGSELHGRVVDREGKPVAGVRVEGKWPSANPFSTRTDADGVFRMRGVPAAEGKLEIANERNWNRDDNDVAPWPFLPFAEQAVPSGSDDVVLTLERGVWIEGELMLPSSIAPEGLRILSVTAQPLVGSWSTRGTGWSSMGDGETRFRVGPLRPGPYRLAATLHIEDTKLETDLEVTAPARGVRVAFAHEELVHGVLRGVDVAGFEAVLLDCTARGPASQPCLIGADGAFEFKPWIEGPWRAWISRPGDERYALLESMSPSLTPTEVTLRRGAEIRGRIDGVPDGFLPRHAHVTARRDDGVLAHGLLDPSWGFVIKGLPPGGYVIEASGLLDDLRWRAVLEDVAAGASGVQVLVTK